MAFEAPQGCAYVCVCAVRPSVEQTAGRFCSAFPPASGQRAAEPIPEGCACIGGCSEARFILISESLGNRGTGAAPHGRAGSVLGHLCPEMLAPASEPAGPQCCSVQGSWVWWECPGPPSPAELWPRHWDAEEQQPAPGSGHPVMALLAVWLGEWWLPSRPSWVGSPSSPRWCLLFVFPRWGDRAQHVISSSKQRESRP